MTAVGCGAPEKTANLTRVSPPVKSVNIPPFFGWEVGDEEAPRPVSDRWTVCRPCLVWVPPFSPLSGPGGPGCSAIDPHESAVTRHDDGHQRGGSRRRRSRSRGRRTGSPPEQQQQEAAERGRGGGRRRGPPSADGAHAATAAAAPAAAPGGRPRDDPVFAGAPSLGTSAAASAAADGRDVIHGGDGPAVAMGAAQSARDLRG